MQYTFDRPYQIFDKHPSLYLQVYTSGEDSEALEANCTLMEQSHGSAGTLLLSETNISPPCPSRGSPCSVLPSLIANVLTWNSGLLLTSH